jgi:hypothetical protein
MTDRPERIGARLQDLTIHVGAEVMRSLQRYNELLQRLAGGDLDDTVAREACVLFMREETERYFRGLAEVSTGYYDALLQLASIYNPPFFEQAIRQAQRSTPAPSQPPAGVIELRGSLGDEAVNSFIVTNTSGRTEDVTFVVSEFNGPPGTVPFRPPLRLRPPSFALAPSESQLVRVSLPLVAGLFVPNQRYRAVLTLRKRDPFDLTINVLAIAPKEDGRG